MISCNFYNYADYNFVSSTSPDVNVILSNLKSDCQISLKWFDGNGMKAYPSKFKFMIMSSENIEPEILPISDNVYLQSQTDVKVLEITIDYRQTFNVHWAGSWTLSFQYPNTWIPNLKMFFITVSLHVISIIVPWLGPFVVRSIATNSKGSKSVHCACYLVITHLMSMIYFIRQHWRSETCLTKLKIYASGSL